MSILRGVGQSHGADLGMDASATSVEVQERRTVTSGRLGTGTMACPECDGPVTLGGQPRALTDRLTCPFCDHAGPVRAFLSLAAPARPARVVVWVSRPAPSA